MIQKQFGPEGRRLRAALDEDAPLTIGIEEELMLLDPETLDLAPVAEALLDRLGDDGRFKPELPAAQLELITAPCHTAQEALGHIAAARADVAAAARGLALPAGAGCHPFTRAPAELNPRDRFDHTRHEYGPIAQRQLVFGVHVHVRVGGVERALAVYNALRSYLPFLAALAANAPFYEGRDAHMASVRPKVSELLPRQGVPPPFADLDELLGAWRWGMESGSMTALGSWWWELRLHPVYGTIEVRVPDQQSRAADSAAIAAVTHCLVAWLAALYDTGEQLRVDPTWRIEENRWVAARHGLEGNFADYDTGARRPVAESIAELLDTLVPFGAALGAEELLGGARGLLTENGAQRQRAIAEEADTAAVCRYLAEQFLAG